MQREQIRKGRVPWKTFRDLMLMIDVFDRRLITEIYSSMKKTITPQTPSHLHSKASKNVSIFIRNNKKQALLVHTSHRTSIAKLAKVISQRLQVPVQSQVLFLNGRQLTSSRLSEMQLSDRAIIHLVDRRNIGREITINVRRLNIPQVEQYTIPASQIIEDFIVRHISQDESDKMFMVYTGRQLNRENSFSDQFVQDQSELFCLHEEKDEVKGQKRCHYENKLKEQRDNKQRRRQKSKEGKLEEEEGGDLWNYLPKDSEEGKKLNSREVDKQEVGHRSQEEPQHEHEQSKPNFKKKNTLKEVNLARKNSKKSHLQGNLSELNQNNFQQHTSALNSQYFNQGSSISQIMAYDSHNPESNKKLEDGSMFNSAYMGLNNEQSSFNGQHRIASNSRISEVNSLEKSNERESFDFDTRAPEMLVQPDRQFTVLEREIQEVTEQSIEEDDSKEKGRQGSKEKGHDTTENKKEDGSNEHSQFQLGQIENHLLSASTQMRVEDPTSPPKNKSKNQILIEDEEQVQEKKQQKIPAIFKDIRREKRSEVDLFTINQHPQESIQSRHTQNPSREQMDTDHPQHVELFMIEQENPWEVVYQKQQCETNHPSSSSNFFSKHSSRVHSNEYQFGAYDRQIARPGIQSRNVERTQPKDLTAHQSCKSESSKIHKSHSENEHHTDSDDLELQVVELPLELKTMEHQSTLKNMSSLMDNFQPEAEKKEERHIGSDTALKEPSKIEELNKLVDDNDQNDKQVEEAVCQKEPNNPIKEHTDSNLLSPNDSEVQIDTSLNNRIDPDNLRSSQQSLEQISLKKTLVSHTSANKIMEKDIKATPHKENFSPASYVFKADLTLFDPLDFYVSLLQKESLQRKQSQPS